MLQHNTLWVNLPIARIRVLNGMIVFLTTLLSRSTTDIPLAPGISVPILVKEASPVLLL